MKDESSAFFEDLLTGLDDIESGKAVTTGASAATYNATRELLESLNEVGVGYGNLYNEQMGIPMEDPMDSYDDNGLDSVYGHYIPQPGDPEYYESPRRVQANQNVHVPKQVPQFQIPPVEFKPGQNWELVEESVQGMKTAKKYGVRSVHSKQVILDNIMMRESALALRNLLNEGESLTNPKILGLISSGIQYTAAMNDIIKAAKQRQSVLRESRYDDAKELDVIIENKKAVASELKNRVMDFLRNEGFIGK